MSASGGARPGLRQRLRGLAEARVHLWIEGADSIYPGHPKRRIQTHPSSWSPVRLLQYGDSDGDPVIVGKYCALSHRAKIFHGGNHHLDWVGVLNAHFEDGRWVQVPGSPYSRGQVVIGNDVYLGYEALVMSGVTIGDGAVIGARAVVTKDVAPYEIVGGNPAKHIKWRFEEPVREALLRIRWWDWPHEKVVRLIDEINSPDVAGFIARHDPLAQEPH